MASGEFGSIFNQEGQTVRKKIQVLGEIALDILEAAEPGNYVVRGGVLIPLADATPEEQALFRYYFGD